MKFICLLLLFLTAQLVSAIAQPVGELGTLTVGPYQSSAQGVLTGRYVPGAKLPVTISYTNTSTTVQDSLAFSAQVLGNGLGQYLQGYFGTPHAVAQYTGQGTFALDTVKLPGPGSYLVQVAGFAYDRAARRWLNGPVKVYWLFPLAAPLPVELVSFAAAAAADSVSVGWETASERNCRHFEVQRSTNGTSWALRKIVPGHGSSLLRHRYRYTEAQLGVRVYYRLRQVDYDGQEHFSPVVVLAPKPVAVDMAKIYPNPARDQAQLTAPPGVLVRFYDEAGRERRQQTLSDTGELNLRGLPAGSYHLVVEDGARTTRTRLVVF